MPFQSVSTLLCITTLVAAGEQTLTTRPADASFETVGLYIDFSSVEELLPFLKACGYNALEFCDASTLIPPADREHYHQRMAAGLDHAQKEGFRVYIILLSNVGPMRRADDPLESLHFPPRDEQRMRQRLGTITEEVRRVRAADGFVFFAGDPGGDPTKQAGIADCLSMAGQVKAIVNREAQRAEFIFNSWAIASWDGWPSPMSVDFWQTETKLTRQVISAPDWIGRSVGMEFPLHNYYRSLAQKCYADAGKEPPSFPSRADVEALRRRGTQRLWGWPYFLIDECDDGYTGKTWGQPQAETRYIHKIVGDARGLGLNGLIGNLSGRGVPAELLNAYAFARMARDASVTPKRAIDEFAATVAENESVETLAHVLAFVENRSSWQAATPAKYRLPDLDTGGLDSPSRALAGLRTVKPRGSTRIPLPIKPQTYLGGLAERLSVLSSQPGE